MKRLFKQHWPSILLAVVTVWAISVFFFPVIAANNNGFLILPPTPVANRVPVTQSTTNGDILFVQVPNAALVNSSTTVNGQTCTLGSTCTVTAAPSGTAGGDLSGSYPSPTVAKVNGTSIPTNSAADQIVNTTASATGQWTSLPNAPNGLGYATSTHTFSALAAPNLIKQCVVITGDPGTASPVLADDNDSPVACGNSWGSDWTITSVSCWANAGTPSVTPILTGGSGTSILTGALTCGTASWAAGTVNGSPVVHSFSANGATCSVTPCTADANITTAGGVAKYIVLRITGTI